MAVTSRGNKRAFRNEATLFVFLPGPPPAAEKTFPVIAAAALSSPAARQLQFPQLWAALAALPGFPLFSLFQPCSTIYMFMALCLMFVGINKS